MQKSLFHGMKGALLLCGIVCIVVSVLEWDCEFFVAVCVLVNSLVLLYEFLELLELCVSFFGQFVFELQFSVVLYPVVHGEFFWPVFGWSSFVVVDEVCDLFVCLFPSFLVVEYGGDEFVPVFEELVDGLECEVCSCLTELLLFYESCCDAYGEASCSDSCLNAEGCVFNDYDSPRFGNTGLLHAFEVGFGMWFTV